MDKRQLGAIAAVILCLWGALEFASLERTWNAQFRDPYLIASQHQRFEGARQIIPADAVVSYLTDLEAGSVQWSAAFNGAQYVLAPRLLEDGAKREWLLVNYGKAADFAALAQQHGYRVERDFQNGVLVMRKQEAR